MLAHWCQRGVALMLIVGAATAFVSSAFAFDVPPNDGYITDASGVTPPLIDSQKEAELEAALADYYAKTSNQIAVVIIRSLGYEQLEDVSLQIARKFGIGDKQHSNGILMLVSYDDRAVRFEVGYGLEGAVPDLVAKGIIETDIIPAFRQGDYAGGIVAAIQALQKHIGNEYTADRYAATTGDNDGMGAFPLFALFIAFQWLLSILARTKSWWLGGVFGFFGGLSLAFLFGWWLSIPILIVLGLFLDFVVSRNYRARGPTSWWAGGNWGPGGGGRWGGGGSGGGFGGFGGGGFGGGGASGRW